jgi:hypothetical protein
MPLKMRPTGLGHGVYKDVPDYSVFCGDGSGRCTRLADEKLCAPQIM